MKVLVYIGANEGGSLSGLIDKFDVVHAFEPDPEVFKELSRRIGHFSHVNLINAACGEIEEEKNFYVNPLKVTSSLAPIADGPYRDHRARPYTGLENDGSVIKVKVINLKEYLEKNNINYIDFYYSDAQGSDLSILDTIKSYVDHKRIGELFIETHRNGIFLYEGLDNQLSGFEKILSDNYEWVYASCDGKIVPPVEADIPSESVEWDCYWRLKFWWA